MPAPVHATIPAPTLRVASGAERVRALDGLRGIAILLVLVMHYFVSVPGPAGSVVHATLQRAFSLGFAGVDLFFVLSGFLIGGILLDHRKSARLLPAFYARRFFRIVPLYAVLLATYFLARATPGLTEVNRGTYFWSTVPEWSFLTFTQNIAMAWQRDIGPYWLGATWSLAVEEQFYLLMPLLVVRLSPRSLVSVCLFLIALSPALRLNALYSAQNGLAAIFLLPTHLDGLLWGVVCAAAARSATVLDLLRARRGELRALIFGLAATLVALAFGKFGADSAEMVLFGYSALSVFFAAALLYVVALPASRLGSALAWRPLTAIGVTSYFIYLFHAPVWYLLHWWLRGKPPLHFTPGGGGVTLLALGVTFLLAAVSWRWFEAPLLRIGRRFSYE